MKLIKAVILSVLALFFGACIAAKSPVPMLETSADNILQTLKANRTSLKSNPDIVYSAVKKYLLPNVDVRGMSRSVLGRQAWRKASPAERKAFTHAFTKLVIKTYSTPLSEYSDEKVKFLPLRGNPSGRFVRVNSVIVRSNGKNIPLSYSLVSKKGQWKVYDLSVEGVSLLQSFRSQFAQVLQNSNMKNLIQQMERKNKA